MLIGAGSSYIPGDSGGSDVTVSYTGSTGAGDADDGRVPIGGDINDS